jgi:serine/threonine-protein kinase
LIGTRLGGYEIQAQIGTGGMASVYRGFDHNLQRAVAIKVLSPMTATLPEFANRFRQEARLIASLRHPNIVHVYDFGEQDGLTYMVQELLPGPTLEQRLIDAAGQGIQLSREDILSITAQLASALDAAHAAGIIHRDVKPSNALWNAYGALVLTDFGIAKNTLTTLNYTEVGLVMGTPTYLSPEQAEGRPLTPESDIYALGVVLYELIAGKAPFVSTTPMRVVMSHIQEPSPPLRPLRLDLPPAAEMVVLRALAKDPDQRFATAGELAQALERAWTTVGASSVEAPGTIHSQVTQHWSSPRISGGAGPVPGPTSQPVGGAAPVARRPAVSRGSTRPLLLPFLGVLLALLLLGGVVLALRGERGANDRTSTAATAPAQALAGTSAPGSLATAAATPPAATTAVLVGQPGAVLDTATTPTAADPIVQLRELLMASAGDGRLGKDRDAVITTLDAAQQALEQGDAKTATAQLQTLQQQLLTGARSGTIAPEVMRQALSGIDAIAHSHGLTLPFSVTAG